jgi:hypothetical protein
MCDAGALFQLLLGSVRILEQGDPMNIIQNECMEIGSHVESGRLTQKLLSRHYAFMH